MGAKRSGAARLGGVDRASTVIAWMARDKKVCAPQAHAALLATWDGSPKGGNAGRCIGGSAYLVCCTATNRQSDAERSAPRSPTPFRPSHINPLRDPPPAAGLSYMGQNPPPSPSKWPRSASIRIELPAGRADGPVFSTVALVPSAGAYSRDRHRRRYREVGKGDSRCRHQGGVKRPPSLVLVQSRRSTVSASGQKEVPDRVAGVAGLFPVADASGRGTRFRTAKRGRVIRPANIKEGGWVGIFRAGSLVSQR
jgi:hypothetical protein